MGTVESLVKLRTLTKKYCEDDTQVNFNELYNHVFSDGPSIQYLDVLLDCKVLDKTILLIVEGKYLDTLKFYKFSLRLLVHEYFRRNGNKRKVKDVFFFQLNNKLRWKFVDKLANFVIDKSIKDYEIKIDILRLFSILQLSEEFGRYIFVHCIYDTDIQLNYSLEDIDDNLSEDVKEKRKNQHWLLQLINSFGIKTDVSLTNWQCAIVRFLLSWCSSRKYGEYIQLFLKAVGAPSYFAIYASQGTIELVNLLKHVLEINYCSVTFSQFRQALRLMFKDHTQLINKVVSYTSLYDSSFESFSVLLNQYLTVSEAKELLDRFIPTEKQANFGSLKQLTDANDKKRFYIDVILTQVYQSSTFKHRFWKFVTEKSFDDIPQDMKFVTHYPTFERFVKAMSFEIKDDGLREIHDHLKVVMGRIKPKNALSYTGTSKYFTKIESLVTLLPQEYEITVDERFEGDEFKFAAAVTICKPVKGENLKKLGIGLVRVGRITKQNRTFIFKCENLEGSNVTHLVFLPNTAILKALKVLSYNNEMIYVQNITNTLLVTKCLFDNNMGDSTEDSNKPLSVSQIFSVKKYGDISMVLPDVTDFHTIVLTPSKTFLQQYKDVLLIRYGDAQSVDAVLRYASEYFKKIQTVLGNGDVLELKKISLPLQLDRILDNCLNKWDNIILTNGNELPSEYLKIVRNPISNSSDAARETTFLKQTIRVIKKAWFLFGKDLNMTVWNYICNSFSVVMTVDDWINVFDKIQVDTSFVYINCDVLVLLMSYFKVDWQKQRSGSIKIIGGGLEDLFSFKTPKEITHKIQSNLSIPTFNPGLGCTKQLISAQNQLEEAELCVLLYRYMRALGYPRESIGIWVSCKRQLDLINEIAKESDLDKDVGLPIVLFNKSGIHDYDHVSYSIVSLFTDSGYKELDCPGTLGNYYFSSNIEVDKELLDLSDSTTDYRLKIVEGEKFGLKERTNESTVAVQSKVQFQKLIDRL